MSTTAPGSDDAMVPMSMDLESLFGLRGRIALVTGGSRGIGAMVAEGLCAAGATVYITARDPVTLRETANRLSEYPGGCVAIPGDVSTMAGIDAVARQIEEREAELHVLVNNAGVEIRSPFSEFTEDQWDTVMDLNLKSVFFTTQRFSKLLEAGASPDNHSKVINMSSITAEKTGRLNDYPYRAAKAGLNQLTRMLGKELARQNISVNALAPGLFRSDMTASFLDDDDLYARFQRSNPVGREGRPEEIAALAIYLASASGNYITGAVIDIDGGLRFVN